MVPLDVDVFVDPDLVLSDALGDALGDGDTEADAEAEGVMEGDGSTLAETSGVGLGWIEAVYFPLNQTK